MSKLPPIPPANRSDKGPGEPDHAPRDKPRQAGERRPEHPDQQGQQGNTRINTTHQGYQQDR
ncbi:hypothetical protein [Bosea thiooxidans]